MFRANIRAMESAAMDMQQQIRKLNRAISDAESVIRELKQLSGMDGVVRSIRREISDMESQRRQILQMLLALGQIAGHYSACESGIVEYAEGVHRKKGEGFAWFQVPFTDNVTERLRQIIY